MHIKEYPEIFILNLWTKNASLEYHFFLLSRQPATGKHKFTTTVSEHYLRLPTVHSCKEPACNAGDPSSIPGSGRSPGERNSNPLQYSCLENPMDGGAAISFPTLLVFKKTLFNETFIKDTFVLQISFVSKFPS